MKIIFISDNGKYHSKLQLNWWYGVLALLIFLTVFGFLLLLNVLHSSYSKQAGLTSAEINYIQSFEALLKKTDKLESELQQLKQTGISSSSNQAASISQSKEQQKSSQQILAQEKMPEAELLKSIKKSEQAQEKRKPDFEKIINTWENKSVDELFEFETNVAVDGANRNGPYLKPIKSFINPVNAGFISSMFGMRKDPLNGTKRHHNGIDIAARKGSEIHTIASGFVTFAGRKGGLGKLIEIHHSDSLKSRYAHLDAINVKKGDVVRKGQVIAKLGQTGRATGPHLHLEVWDGNKPVDPISYVPTAFNHHK